MKLKILKLLSLSLEYKPYREKIHKLLKEAYEIDKTKTIQILLYIRDKNNWAWRRDFIRICLLWLKYNHEWDFNKVLLDFLLVWRWDDIFFSTHIINNKVLSIIKNHLNNNDTLLKKWLPKERSNPTLARVIAKWIGLTMKEYRLAIKKNEWHFINTLFRPINSYRVTL